LPSDSEKQAREIRIAGARTHNLRSVDCAIPLRQLTVISGPSGSGKSSLAFDTLYAEGQRRYVSSLSTYARQFLDRLPRPDVDSVSHVPPAIAIEQRNTVTNARATVGSATEILDYLRLLLAKIGVRRCCGERVDAGTVDSVVQRLQARFGGIGVSIGVAIPDRKESADMLLREGYTRLLEADGSVREIEELPVRGRRKRLREGLSLIDRVVVDEASRTRLAEAVAEGFRRGAGVLVVHSREGQRVTFHQGSVCSVCGTRYPEPVPALFSWNSALGACPGCEGFGRVPNLDLERVVPDPARSVREGAIAPFGTPSAKSCQRDLLAACKTARFPATKPWSKLTAKQREWVIEGDDAWYGVRGYFAWLEKRRYKVQARIAIARYRRFDPCPECAATRLRSEALGVTVGGANIGELAAMTLGELAAWLKALELEASAKARGEKLLALLQGRVATALRVGLGYLSLDRQVRTLSGGEAQRIQLATALGGALTSALYVLDEPSVGLHAEDVSRLLAVLYDIRDQGNTVVVVEHAPEIVAAADHVIELGPGAGHLGGQIVGEGAVAEIAAIAESPTGRVLRGELAWRDRKRRAAAGALKILGAREHNLQDIDVEIPLGQLVVVSGVSGAGKSTLIRSVLVGELTRDPERGACRGIEGREQVEDVVLVEPTPPGKSRRSNPATVSKAFDGIRKQLAGTHDARVRGFEAGWFSFNRPGGRCEHCEGTGELVVDMQFLEDVRVPCEHCGGTRYGAEAQTIRLAGRTVVEILDLSIDEAREVFAADPKIVSRLEPFARVGLGYLRMSQPLTTLSGGELQRLRLASALADGRPGALYVLDEPTTGLHAVEVQQLIGCLDELLDGGASVVVVEHNLEVIAQADWVIDMGPEGGPGGGRVVACGTPREIARSKRSATGRALASAR
jgi:excinuclease ABC subunit A